MPITNRNKMDDALQNASGQIKYPTLFQMSKDEKQFLLLGTMHTAPLQYFSEPCLREFSTCSTFVSEVTLPPVDNLRKFFASEFIEKFKCQPKEENWFRDLSLSQQATVRKYFNAYFQYLPEDCIPKADPQDITPGLVQDLVLYMTRNFFAPEKNQHNQHVDDIGMDSELIEIFFDSRGKKLGLSENIFFTRFYDCSKDEMPINMFKVYLDEVQAIERALLEKLPYEGGEVTIASKKLTTEFLQHDYMYNFKEILNQHIEDRDDDFKFAKENIEFFKGLLTLSKKLPGKPLFGVGMAHLVGSIGLLSLLRQANFKVQRMDSNGHWHDFSDPYFHYNHSYSMIRAENEKFKSNITPLYNKLQSNAELKYAYIARNDFCEETINDLKKSKLNGCFNILKK